MNRNSRMPALERFGVFALVGITFIGLLATSIRVSSSAEMAPPSSGASRSDGSSTDYVNYVMTDESGKGDDTFQTNGENEPLWSYDTGSDVLFVSISSDGSYIVASSETIVYLFSKDSNTPLWSYDTRGDVYSVSISADGYYVAAGSGGSVYLFSKVDNTPLWSYNASGLIYSVSISSNGSYIAAGAGHPDCKVYLFSMADNIPLWSYDTGSDVYSVSISSNGNYIVAGTSGNNVYLLSKDNNIPLWSYDTDSDVYSVSTSSNGNYIVAGTSGSVYLFSKDDNIPLWSYDTGSDVGSVSISSDGSYIAAVSGGSVYLFPKDSNDPLWSYDTGSWVYSVSISFDGSYIAAGGYPDVYLFFTDTTPPPAPVLLSPPNYATINDNTPTFVWENVYDFSGVTYTLQYSTDNAFQIATTIENLFENTYTVADENALSENTYYWRVRAVDGAGNVSNWLDNWQFRIDTISPSAPALVSPENNENILDNTPTFVWTSVSDPSGVTYQIQIDDNSDFSSLVYSAIDLAGNAHTLPDENALALGKYYWHVRAKDGAGNVGDWSESRAFTVTTSVSFTLDLRAGWNMASFPVQPDNRDPDSMFSGYYLMYRWDAAGRSYVTSGGSSVEPDEPIENGVGYWVYVLAAENVLVSGTPVDNLTLSLSTGWNLIGSPLGGASIANPDDTPDNSVLPPAYTWSGSGYVNTTDLVAGAGYWVYALNSCTLRL